MNLWEIAFVLCCFFGWGFSTFIMGFLGKVISYETALFYNLIGVALCNLLIAHRVNFGMSANHFWAILNGVAFTLADFAYYKLSKGGMHVSTLGPLTSLYVLMPIILGIVVLKEPITTRKVVGFVLAITAIYILSTEHEPEEIHHVHHEDIPDEEKGI